MPDSVLVIACGALAREINALRETCGWTHMHLECIDARLHNRPAEIPLELCDRIRKHQGRFERIFVAYADCGTGGEIDRVLATFEGQIERLPGAHCYQFFAGGDRFAELAAADPGTFYLTDFLARNFDRLVIEPLKLDTHPELRDEYFRNYSRLVFLSQTNDAGLLERARRAARRLGLAFEHVHTGYGELEATLRLQMAAAGSG